MTFSGSLAVAAACWSSWASTAASASLTAFPALRWIVYARPPRAAAITNSGTLGRLGMITSAASTPATM